MKKIHALLNEYGDSHHNPTNKSIHWICVPSIMFSLLGIFYAIPFIMEKGMFANWAFVILTLALIYYLILSTPMFLGFIIVGGLMLCGVQAVYEGVGSNSGTLALIMLGIFVLAWIGQFVGHKIEGKKPSFLKDVQFLLVGPAWLLHFIFNRLGISY